jgi:hypothetical protein
MEEMIHPQIKSHLDLLEGFSGENDMTFILEVQTRIEMEGYKHIGYTKALFNFRNEAADYYNTYNPHMRKLNAHRNWVSDWGKNTNLRYIVRPFNQEILDIPPFNIADSPII